MNEFSLIEKIKKIVGNDIIGDDTAPIKIGGETFVFTNDILLEGQHFLDYFPMEFLGWKAISVNVSDIVASGGKPKYALVSLLLPKDKTSQVEEIYQSIKKACQHYHCQIIGGNITKSEKLGIDIFMIGRTKRFVTRRGAKPGDGIYLSGAIGDSRAGLELLKMKKNAYEKFEKILIEKHLKPVADIDLSDYLSQNATASIDLSDGLSSDVYRLAEMSKVRIDVDSKKIPVSLELRLFCKKYHCEPIDYALTGGEDYKILFAQKKPSSLFTKIGVVKNGSGVFLDGKKLKNKSFDHFSPS